MIVYAVSSCSSAKDLLTKPIGLERVEIFGLVKRKLNLPSRSTQVSRRFDKVNYSISHMNTRFIYARVKEATLDPIHGVQHTTSMLESDCDHIKWHIA